MHFFLVLAGINGGIVTLSRLVNSRLGSYVGSLKGSFINHVVGSLFAGLLLLVGLGTGHIYFNLVLGSYRSFRN